jgi:hypothetical protein
MEDYSDDLAQLKPIVKGFFEIFRVLVQQPDTCSEDFFFKKRGM